MRIGIIGAGRIGGNIARQAVRVGHQVIVSYARDLEGLRALAGALGAEVGAPAYAVEASDLVVISVPWSVLPDALTELGDLAGRIVIDTTNPYGTGPKPAAGQTAASFNKSRMPGGRYTKSFNTLTSEFQTEVAGRTGSDRVVQWLCGDDPEAKTIVATLIDDLGYVAIDVGGTAECAVMESPRRPGAVFGEEYRAADARLVLDALHANAPIPPIPRY